MNTTQTQMKGVVLLGGALALAALGIGCGRHASDQQASSASTNSLAVPVAQVGLSPGASSSARLGEAAPLGQSDVGTSIDSLPPDILASISDTLVTPGAVVEITVNGSEDVTEVVLSDGIGKKQPCAFDSTEKVWHAFYRVPMKAQTERLGLSVTAKNGANRWRRVWVFVNVEPDQVEVNH